MENTFLLTNLIKTPCRCHRFVSAPLFTISMIGLLTLVPSYANANESGTSAVEQQQTDSYTGVVKDEYGEPVIVANVVVKGTTNGTVTDHDGRFRLPANAANADLLVTFIGYAEITVKVKANSNAFITLKENSEMLSEVQVVAYGTQKKVTVTGALSTVKGEELMKSPVSSLSNALTGKLTGVSSVQYSGEPGADAANIYVRGIGTLNESGATPLILVDGVERDFTQIDPNEVDNITVLKDASATAVFGVRGANGVIIVTTKRGVEGKAKVSFSSSVGVQMPTRLPEFANSYQYASFYNEAQMNDGISADNVKFSPEVLQAFKDHSQPLLYPDVDWMDYLLKKGAMQSQHNVNVSGGTERVRYFASVGVFTQEGLFKTFDSGNDFNFDYKRYNYRANLDIDITKTTKMAVNIGGRVEDKNTPISSEDQNQLFRHLYWATPFSGAGIVDGKWIKTNTDYINTPGSDGLSPYYGKGYNSKTTNVLNLDLQLEQNLDVITKGLSAKVKGSYNSTYVHVKQRSSSLPFYTPVLQEDGTVEFRKSGDDSQLGYGESFDSYRDWYAEMSINYSRKFGSHNISALALYNQSKSYYPRTYTDIPSGYVGLVGRVTYDYASRYMVDLNVGYNGSENFAPGKRYGLFPAVSLGWTLTEEKFMKNQEFITFMKLRASYGVVGNDKIYNNGSVQRFLYLPDSYVLGGSGYNFGTNVSSSTSGAYEGMVGNKEVTWETATKQNYGIDLNVLDNRLSFGFDYFFDHRKDILINRNTVPSFVAIQLPAVNMGVVDNKGYEISLKWNDKIGEKFTYWANANLSFARNKIVEQDEVTPNEDYMWRTGNPVGQPFVRKFWGFYDENANEKYKAQYGTDIATHAGGLEPGDCVYVDLNGDGVIDTDDITALGYTNNPEYAGGVTLGFSWKGFDFSMLWNYAWNTSRLLEETFREPMGDTNAKGLLLSQYTDRWTPETASTATLPRATMAHKTNNYAASDLWLVDASYLRLKSIEIGYNFNFPFMKRAGLNQLRLYGNGYNLLTFDKLKISDPESRTNSRPAYPLTKVFNVGLKVGF